MTHQRRSRPDGGIQAAPTATSTARDYSQSSGDYRHQVLTADERREAELLAELRDRGYTISVRCTVCNHPLTADLSTALHVGPKCRARTVAAG